MEAPRLGEVVQSHVSSVAKPSSTQLLKIETLDLNPRTPGLAPDSRLFMAAPTA